MGKTERSYRGSIDSQYTENLNRSEIPQELKTILAISDQASVRTLSTGQKWVLTDHVNYLITKETDKGKDILHIYAKKAFVIMPFHQPFLEYYQDIFKPALESVGYNVSKGDDNQCSADIMANVRKAICASDLVLVEMTDLNANVYYELGLGHAIGTPTIMVYGGENIPFNVGHLTAIKYDSTKSGWEKRLQSGIATAAPGATSPPPLRKEAFAQSQDDAFRGFAKELLLQSRTATLIGVGLNLIQDDTLLKKLESRVKNGETKVEIYLGNPFSSSVRTRLVEEELGTMKPPVAKEGLIRRLQTLIRAENDWNSKNFSVNVFSHYPTFAILKFDARYFFYPYGLATLGNFSPVFECIDPNVIEFFDAQIEIIKKYSVKASALPQFRINQTITIQELEENKYYGMAVFIVPDKGEPFYVWGSEVLGYDGREHKEIDSKQYDKWSKYRGQASNFGLHITIADALFTLAPYVLDWAEKEVEELVTNLTPFQLTNLRLSPDFPDPAACVVEFDDDSGQIEWFHNQLVHKFYSLAAYSYYSLPAMPQTRGTVKTRDQFIQKHHLAPYILGKFRPHFTLLGDILSNRKKVIREVETIFKKCLGKKNDLKVGTICLMEKTPGDPHWKIRREFILR